jgi:murein L,D-transpeptidase YcbB/YkuD
MLRFPLRLALAAVVVFPVACTRTSRQGGPEGTARQSGQSAPADRTSEALKAHLSAEKPPSALAGQPGGADLWKGLRRLYEARGYQPLWIKDGRARPEVAVLRDAVQRAAEEGLNPSDYDVQAAETLLAARPAGLFRRETVALEPLVEADLRFSSTLLKFASHLQRGRVPPGQVDKHWFGRPSGDDLVKLLQASLESGTLEKGLDQVKPRHPQYAALKQALARYREIAARGGWPALPAGLTLKRGQAHPQVAALRQRLAATGDLPASAATASANATSGDQATAPAGAPAAGQSPAAAGPVFDKETQEALGRFERRHGLTADGRLDREVLAALNVAVEARIRQIELNLERWRWLPETLGERYVLVNIPTFHLTAVDNGRTELDMRVVGGTQENPTPIFTDEMTTVVFSPYWNVPAEIARNETIPAMMRDPDYVHRNNLEVVRGSRVVNPWSIDWSNPGRVRFRQRPGANNALGGVKFIFPNTFDVYLHDTPADSLFARVERDYSHGCVRVEKPFELAQWALKSQPEWTAEKIRAAMASGREQHVALEKTVGVFIIYETVWVDDDGTLEFRDDIYGHDARQERVLPRRPAQGMPVARRTRPAPGDEAATAPRVADVR